MQGRLQSKFVSKRAQANYGSGRNVAEIAVMSKVFACKYIAQVNLDKRNPDREQCVPDGYAGMRKRSRVEQYEFNRSGCLLNPVDNFVLGVALKRLQFVTAVGRLLRQALFNVRQVGSGLR